MYYTVQKLEITNCRPAVTICFMGFSLVECVATSFSERETTYARNIQPPAMRVRSVCYTKKSPFRYNKVVQADL